MFLLITMVLMGVVDLGICDPLTHVYEPYCEPPYGFIHQNTTYVTPVYKEIYPIERCCPVCHECLEIGGYCKVRWLPELYPDWCDFTSIHECRDYSCTCCVKCADDKCSPCTETGGECRVECRYGEIEDKVNKCAFHATKERVLDRSEGCKCCKRCEATSECTDVGGKCVTHPDDCHHGSFASTGCCGGCYCCKPVLQPVAGSTCATSGGYCVEVAEECANGYYPCFGECSKTLFNSGLKTVELGYCCIPKQTGSVGPGRIDQQPLMMDQEFAHQEQQLGRRHPRELLE